MSVTYEARVRQPRWIAGSKVVLDLRILNSSAAPFETPDPMYRTSSQPHFEVTGPDGRKQEFRPDSRATDWDRSRPPTLVRLAPGQHWEGDFELSLYANVEAPGKYALRSWIDHNGARIESAPSEFTIVRAGTQDLAAETAFGEDNSIVVECVELLEGGQVASSMLRERDPRNSELLPFTRRDRGATDPSSTAIHAPYSNFSVGLSVIRWIVGEHDHKLTVGHNMTQKRVPAFGGAELGRILPPVATKAGLYLAAIRGSELVLERIAANENTVEPGTVWTVAKLPSVPAAATLTLSPESAGNTLLFALAWNGNTETRVQFLTVNQNGKVLARAEHVIPGVRPLGPAAAGWSSTGEVRAGFLVRSATQATEVRAAEIRLSAALAVEGTPLSEPIRLDFPLQDARFAYFESRPGALTRMVLVRTSGGKTWVIPADGPPRAPQTPFPTSGPLAILPGQVYWYAVWPDAGKLAIGPL